MKMTNQTSMVFNVLMTAAETTADRKGCPHVGQLIACELTSREHAGQLISSGAAAAVAGAGSGAGIAEAAPAADSSKERSQSWHHIFPEIQTISADLQYGQFI